MSVCVGAWMCVCVCVCVCVRVCVPGMNSLHFLFYFFLSSSFSPSLFSVLAASKSDHSSSLTLSVRQPTSVPILTWPHLYFEKNEEGEEGVGGAREACMGYGRSLFAG